MLIIKPPYTLNVIAIDTKINSIPRYIGFLVYKYNLFVIKTDELLNGIIFVFNYSVITYSLVIYKYIILIIM